MRDYFTPPPKTYIRLLAPSDSSISVFSKNSPYNTIYEHVNIMKATKPAGWTQRERVVSTCFALLKLWFFKKQLPLKDGSKMRQRTFGVAWTMTKVSTVIRIEIVKGTSICYLILALDFYRFWRNYTYLKCWFHLVPQYYTIIDSNFIVRRISIQIPVECKPLSLWLRG